MSESMLKLPLILVGAWAMDRAVTSPNPVPLPSELVGNQAEMERNNRGAFRVAAFLKVRFCRCWMAALWLITPTCLAYILGFYNRRDYDHPCHKLPITSTLSLYYLRFHTSSRSRSKKYSSDHLLPRRNPAYHHRRINPDVLLSRIGQTLHIRIYGTQGP